MNPAALLKPFSAAFAFITRHPRIFAGAAAVLVAAGLLWFAYDWAYDRGYDASSEKSNKAYVALARQSADRIYALQKARDACEASIKDLRLAALEEQQWRDRAIRDLERELERLPAPALTVTEEYTAKDLLRDVTKWRD